MIVRLFAVCRSSIQGVLTIYLIGVFICAGVLPSVFRSRAILHAQTEATPSFKQDTSWPKELPYNWRLGIVWAVAVDSRDHVWVLHEVDRYLEDIAEEGMVPAPPVVEFDPDGNLVQAWGGRDQGKPWVYRMEPEPLVGEHGLNVDDEGDVWVTGGGHLVLKFSSSGEFLLQIGQLNKTNGSNDPRYLGNPSGVDFDIEANEVYVADGYLNKRIIVYDADTGAYKRHWGRYGRRPDDSFEADRPFPRFAHAVQVSRDDLVYVPDREHSSIHVHRSDGTFITEVTLPAKINSVAFSADAGQEYLYAGGMRTGLNGRYDLNAVGEIFILRRNDLQLLGSFDSAGQHFFDVDSKGNIFTCGRFMPEKFTLQEVSNVVPPSRQ